MFEVLIDSVRVSLMNYQRVVILKEKDSDRYLPIWIGPAEARSIASELEKRRAVRPNFHDLARSLIHKLDATVDRVVVTSLRGGTYYGVLHLKVNARSIEIDVRPSDGIAVALRTEAPILVRDSVFTRAGETLEGEPTGRPVDWPQPMCVPSAIRRINHLIPVEKPTPFRVPIRTLTVTRCPARMTPRA